MSELASMGASLAIDLDRYTVAAEVAESDAEMLRQAVLDALEIYGIATAHNAAEGVQPTVERNEMLAAAAGAMAKRLQELHRVHVSSEEIELPSELGLDLG